MTGDGELTQQEYARLRSIGQFDTLEAQYFALRARLEAAEQRVESLKDRCNEAAVDCVFHCDELLKTQQRLAAVTQEREEAVRMMHGVIEELQIEKSSLAVAEGRVRELVKFYDDHHGTPCEQIRHAQEIDTLTTRLAQVEAALLKPNPCFACGYLDQRALTPKE